MFVYIKVKLEIDDFADPDEVVSETDYSFKHDNITDTEIVDIMSVMDVENRCCN